MKEIKFPIHHRFDAFRVGVALAFLFFAPNSASIVVNILSVVCGTILLLGWRTPIFAILCWLLFAYRIDGLTVYAGDRMLQILLFWVALLPMARNGFAIQLGILYFFSGLLKALEPAWQEGLGAYYAFSSIFGTAWGEYLSQSRPLVVGLNYATLVIEMGAPLIFFVSEKNHPRLKKAGLLCLVLFHLAIAATLRVWSFQAFMILALWPLFPIQESQPGRLNPNKKLIKGMINGMAVTYLIIAGFFNLQTAYQKITGKEWLKSPAFARVLYRFGLKQYWGVFSKPHLTDHRMQVTAFLRDHTQIELPPQNEQEWRMRMNLLLDQNQNRRAEYAASLCLPDAESIELKSIEREILREGGKAEPRTAILLEHPCPHDQR